MSSLADLLEVAGFFSYSRDDDDDSRGRLSALRDAIQRELSGQLGLSKTNFRLWQDQEAIAFGELWEAKIKEAIEQAVFFIRIVTPRAVNSRYCKFEFEAFLARENALSRTDLRQYADWRALRYLDIDTRALREAVGRFCDKIAQALQKPWISPEEREKR